MLRVIISATCLVVASPSVVQQVRIITGDIEYVHGPGGQVLDDSFALAWNARFRSKGPSADLDQQESTQPRRVC
jgi:hypothetical protein